MSKIFAHPWVRRLALAVLVCLIAAGMASSLSRHGGPMFRAASDLSMGHLGLALFLSLAYRVVNATGWGLILGALGEPVKAIPAARIWLASEACRWLPGSLWSFGSRAVLATRRGLAGPVVAASLALELVVTTLAWGVVALVGFRSLKWPESWTAHDPSTVGAWILGTLLIGGALGYGASHSSRVRNKVAGTLDRLRGLRTAGVDGRKLFRGFLFYVAMGIFNGLTLVVIVRSIPGGSDCPIPAIIAANAISWIVGFFALFAPGGLIVREACLASMLVPWMSPGQAIAIALAWRLIQIIAEAGCFAGIVATGLPQRLRTAHEPQPDRQRSPAPLGSSRPEHQPSSRPGRTAPTATPGSTRPPISPDRHDRHRAHP
ncbi:lysylphosphatidylglycerol synthase transmembrane domain-containing protein [Tundrisphaera lichenicola]|uniref:lysylphosphatidylglycerol synthase transmembrane domain-containing protein n=1 Tax=Tundrisphaera lichenicola TaxID=2029860 RepID=UPI003EBFC08A